MPLVRCRYYDENGAPIPPGCRRPDCTFVHPSDPRWRDAHMPRNRLYQNARPFSSRDPAPSGSGWNTRRDSNSGRDRDRDKDRGGWGDGWANSWANENASPTRSAPSAGTSSNAIPTGSRRPRDQEPAGASKSSSASGWGSGGWDSGGWGSAPMGGTTWGDDTNAATTSQTPASGSASGPGPAAQTSSFGDWGDSTTLTGWGTVPDVGWGQPEPNTEPDKYIWGDPAKDKDKDKEQETGSAPTPQAGLSTPQLVPQSPVRSPQDSRRRISSASGATPGTTVMSPADDQTTAMNMARDIRKERDGTRMSSFGVPMLTAHAGPEGTSSSKPNPFSFGEYTPADRMDVSRDEPEPGQVADGDTLHEGEIESEEIMNLSRPGSPALLQAPKPPVELKGKWKEHTALLSRAVSLRIECDTLEEQRRKHRNLQHSRQFNSASLVTIHETLNKLRHEHEEKLQKARRRFNQQIDTLATRYPLDGLPVFSPDDPRQKELDNVCAYVAQIKEWLERVQPLVTQHQDARRRMEEKKREVEAAQRRAEERKRAEEERAKAKEEAGLVAGTQSDANKRPRTPSLTSRMHDFEAVVGRMDERVTDLEYRLDEARSSARAAQDVVKEKMVERGLRKEASKVSVEDGEMPFEPPKPPMTAKELTEAVADLRKRLKEAEKQIVRGWEMLEDQRQRNLTKMRGYHELAGDNATLSLQMTELVEVRKQHSTLLEENDNDLASLRTLLEQCQTTQRPLPPPAPTPEQITQKLLSVVLPELQVVVQEGLGRLKTGVQDTMQRQEAIVCTQLAAVLQPAVNVVKIVKPFMDRQAAEIHSQMQMPPPPPPVQSMQHS